MQVSIDQRLKSDVYALKAEEIIRSCVHCGFCNATCPTYQLLSDELDGPRGRIYIIKDFLEGKDLSQVAQVHLDRCLQCQSCETTCPSGVRYGRLIDIGKHLLERQQKRNPWQRGLRRMLLFILPHPKRFSSIIKLLRLLPGVLVKQNKHKVRIPEFTSCRQKVQLLPGCVQNGLRPSINQACQSVLSRLGILGEETKDLECCGSVQYHMGDFEAAKKNMRRNIDIWCSRLDEGSTDLLSTATGCSKFIKEYPFIFQDDPVYANKASRVAEHFSDISEFMQKQSLQDLLPVQRKTIAFHSPCTLQHGLKQAGVIETLLRHSGANVLTIQDGHLCCGSAGTYSILQKKLSGILRDNKIKALEKNKPDVILTANMACLLHLNKAAKTPIYHWIEYLDHIISSK